MLHDCYARLLTLRPLAHSSLGSLVDGCERCDWQAIKDEGRIVVCCKSGESRAPAVVIAFLCKAKKAKFDTIYAGALSRMCLALCLYPRSVAGSRCDAHGMASRDVASV